MACWTGTLKSFLGVSASLASSIYLGAYQPDGLSFLLFVAVLPLFVAVLAVPLLNHVPYVEEAEVEHGHWWSSTGEYSAGDYAAIFSFLPFWFPALVANVQDEVLSAMCTGARFLATYAVAGAIVVYQLVTASISEAHPFSMPQQRGIMIGVLVLLFIVLLTPFGSGGLKSRVAILPMVEHSDRYVFNVLEDFCSSLDDQYVEILLEVLLKEGKCFKYRMEHDSEDVESAQLLSENGEQSSATDAGQQQQKQGGLLRNEALGLQRPSSRPNLHPGEDEEGMPEYTLAQCLVCSHALWQPPVKSTHSAV